MSSLNNRRDGVDFGSVDLAFLVFGCGGGFTGFDDGISLYISGCNSLYQSLLVSLRGIA